MVTEVMMSLSLSLGPDPPWVTHLGADHITALAYATTTTV